MFVSKLMLLFGLPMGLILLGVFFGLANPTRALAGIVVGIALICIVIFFGIDQGGIILLFSIGVASLIALALPWVATVTSLTGEPIRPSPAQIAGEKAKAVYESLTPEEREKLKRLGKGMFRVSLTQLAKYFKRKGKPSAAGFARSAGTFFK